MTTGPPLKSFVKQYKCHRADERREKIISQKQRPKRLRFFVVSFRILNQAQFSPYEPPVEVFTNEQLESIKICVNIFLPSRTKDVKLPREVW